MLLKHPQAHQHPREQFHNSVMAENKAITKDLLGSEFLGELIKASKQIGINSQAILSTIVTELFGFSEKLR